MNQKQLAEYNMVRSAVGFFDFSLSTKIYISGRESLIFLNRLMGGNVETMHNGKIINSLFMRDDGSLLATVWVLKDEAHYIILTDAEKRVVLFEWIMKYAEDYDVQIEDKTEIFGSIVIVGPKGQELLMAIAGDDIIGLPYLGFEHNTQTNCLICRIGYSGEYEYRLIFPNERYDNLQRQIMEKGGEYGMTHCDKDILDTLMFEMKLVNQNKDILEDTTPIQAGLHWMIDFRKSEFVGRDAVMKEKKSPSKKLLLLLSEERMDIPDQAKLFIENIACGLIVKKSFSPTLNKDIFLAYIDEKFAWVGINFDIETIHQERGQVRTVSGPLFITKTLNEAASH